MERSEDFLTKKRFADLSRLADRKGDVTFSNFLNLNELNLFYEVLSELQTAYRLYGGYEFAERQMIAFIPDALSYITECGQKAEDTVRFPLVCLHIRPTHPKFAEELSHRDVLGTLMGLGIERSRIGDIRQDGQAFYVFCEEGISDYVMQSLVRIRHTAVTAKEAEAGSYRICQEFETVEGIVSSCRLDSLVALLTRLSRDKSAALIRAQKVFVNSRTAGSNACLCKEGDVLSIRGFGKYIYLGSGGETRKGRIKVTLKKYI